MKVRQHFRAMKARQKTRKVGLHVLSLPPKVADIYEQIHKPRFSGQKVSLRCPYCQVLNIQDQPFCCNDFRDALMMIREANAVPVTVN